MKVIVTRMVNLTVSKAENPPMEKAAEGRPSSIALAYAQYQARSPRSSTNLLPEEDMDTHVATHYPTQSCEVEPELTVTNIAIDIETDGTNERDGHIMEVAAVATDEDGLLLDVFHSYVYWDIDEVDFDSEAFKGRPAVPGEKEAYGGNHITWQTVCTSPSLVKVMQQFSDFVWKFEAAPNKPDESNIVNLIFQNAPFDVGFLKNGFRDSIKAGWKPRLQIFRRVIELSTMGRVLLDMKKPPSLKSMGDMLGIPNTKKHSAMGDAIQTSNIYHALMDISQPALTWGEMGGTIPSVLSIQDDAEHIRTSLDSLNERFKASTQQIEVKDHRSTFGNHRSTFGNLRSTFGSLRSNGGDG
jgi:DNA polymerase III epsilon subunit-like protein